jgi:hypothetical protein
MELLGVYTTAAVTHPALHTRKVGHREVKSLLKITQVLPYQRIWTWIWATAKFHI